MTHSRFSCPCLVAALFAATPAMAQPSGDDDSDEGVVRLEDIRVTADFRGQAARDLPVSLTVLDGATIADAGVQHFQSLAQLVPNLNWAGASSRPRYFQIRGIGELEQYQGAPNPSVGFIVDDIDFSGLGMVTTLFDTQQIEVLRGPQGTRYGANALAGLINVRTVEPTAELSFDAQALAGQDNALAGGVAVGGPLGDTAAYRLVAHQYKSDGFRNNSFLDTDDTNKRDELTTRAKLRWRPTDSVRVKLTGMYVDIDNGYDAWALDNSLTTLSDKPGGDSQESTAAAVEIAWDAHPAFGIVSITTVADSDIEHSFDGDWANDASYDFTSATFRDRQTLSQEIRFTSAPGAEIFSGSTSWLAGVYVLDLDESVDTTEFFNGALWSDLMSDYEATNVAIFGQLDTALGGRTTLSVGLRGEHRETDYRDTVFDPATGMNSSAAYDPTDDMLGGQVTLSYEPGERTRLYASLSRGYKAGGFNIGPVFADPDFPDPDAREYDPEYLWNYELGLKGSWLDGALYAGLALFYTDRDDLQIRSAFQADPNDPLTFTFFTDNAPSGSNAGLEAELRWAFHANWLLHAALGYLDTEFEDYVVVDPLLGVVELDGRDQPHAPSYTYAAGLTYRDQRGLFGRIDVTGKDEFFYDVNHHRRSEAYDLVHLKLGWEGQQWSGYVWGRNVLDEDHTVRGFFFANEPPWVPKQYTQQGDPQQFGVTVSYRY